MNNEKIILVLNAGSSSEKLALYRGRGFSLDKPEKPIWFKNIEVQHNVSLEERTDALEQALSELWKGSSKILESKNEIDCVGHRVVHGGAEFEKPAVVTAEIKQSIRKYSQFAPLQNPFNLLGIEASQSILPGAKQVAVFDTAFHSTLPEVAKYYPLPTDWSERFGVRRYGFHGISHLYLSRRAAVMLGRDLESLRLVTCHLGSGSSLAAVLGGNSIDTTMGFTTLDGLMMATRCGSLDPGIVTYLSQNAGMSVDEISHALYFESGLKGVSGLSDDLREIERAAANGHSRSKLAIDMYIDRLAKWVCAMVTAMNGVDAIIFSGGIGENSATVRSAVANRLSFLGLRIDPEANARLVDDSAIDAPDSSCQVLVIKTQEGWAIACDCFQLLQV